MTKYPNLPDEPPPRDGEPCNKAGKMRSAKMDRLDLSIPNSTKIKYMTTKVSKSSFHEADQTMKVEILGNPRREEVNGSELSVTQSTHQRLANNLAKSDNFNMQYQDQLQ